jgi:hypothetical protein
MPTLISETDVKLERSDLGRRIMLPRQTVVIDGLHLIPEPVRAKGLHLSGLLRYVAEKSRISARMAEVSEEEMPLRWALGVAWEEYAASLMPEMTWQPGEIKSPCIMNCDGLTLTTSSVLVVNEFKFNRAKKYSGEDLIKKKWLWMMQGGGYCTGYGAQQVEWNVLSAMEWPDPVWTRYLVEFEPDEVDRIANMIEINREGAMAEGYAE